MLLINGKPAADDFLKKYAENQGVDVNTFVPKKTESFKLQDSFFRKTRQKEMKTGKWEDRVLVAPEWGIPNTYDFFNPFTYSNDKLTYTSNYLPDANGVNKNTFEQVTFDYGYISVAPNQSDLYFWLMYHPLNQFNPRYLGDSKQRPPKPFMFKQILPNKENEVFIDHEKLVAKVTLMLTDKDTKGYINNEALLYLAKSYGIGSTINKGRKDAEKFLLTFAKKNPQKMLEDLTSSTTEIRAVIADAEQYQVIKFDIPYVKFVDTSKGKRTVNGGIICQIANGLEPIDFFVNWLREKDNSGVYNQLKKELDEKKLAEIEAAQAV